MKIIQLERKQIDEADKVLVIHYSCDDINNEYPAISSISAYDTKKQENNDFRRSSKKQSDELRILNEFFSYLSNKLNKGYYLLGWHWGDKYGIKAIVERYNHIKKANKFKIKTIRYFDLIKLTNLNHSPFLGLKGLAIFNNIDTKDFVDGKTEIKLFNKQKYKELCDSTHVKVMIIQNLFKKYFNKSIKIPTIEELLFGFKDVEPYRNFRININKIKQLISINIGTSNKTMQDYLRQLLYINVITILEAYLSETFIEITISNKKFLNKYIKNSNNFSKQKETLTELYTELYNKYDSNTMDIERYVKNKCMADMRHITFHNLKVAGKLYLNVLGVEFPKEMQNIYKAVDIRHDLVHRNGKDKDDNEISISLNDLEKLIKDILVFVVEIRKKTKMIDIGKIKTT